MSRARRTRKKGDSRLFPPADTGLPLLPRALLTPRPGKAAWMTKVPGIPGPHVLRPPTCEELEMEDDPGIYPDWTEENSRIVRAHHSAFDRAEDAMDYFRSAYGHVYQNLSTAAWWAARVPRFPPRGGDA